MYELPSLVEEYFEFIFSENTYIFSLAVLQLFFCAEPLRDLLFPSIFQAIIV